MAISRRTWLAGGVAAAAGAAGAWWGMRGASGESLDESFWSLEFERPEGGRLRFAALRNRRVLLNFWATWCPPCVEELPALDRFYREQAANGWQVVGLAIDQPSAVRQFLARRPVTFPIGLAGLEGTELTKRLGNIQGGLPFTLVVAASGRVGARKIGQLGVNDLAAWQRA